jgi:hypothetical protein
LLYHWGYAPALVCIISYDCICIHDYVKIENLIKIQEQGCMRIVPATREAEARE